MLSYYFFVNFFIGQNISYKNVSRVVSTSRQGDQDWHERATFTSSDVFQNLVKTRASQLPLVGNFPT
jgi:hypothetical protein